MGRSPKLMRATSLRRSARKVGTYRCVAVSGTSGSEPSGADVNKNAVGGSFTRNCLACVSTRSM